jgi:hypothetical protein
MPPITCRHSAFGRAISGLMAGLFVGLLATPAIAARRPAIDEGAANDPFENDPFESTAHAVASEQPTVTARWVAAPTGDENSAATTPATAPHFVRRLARLAAAEQLPGQPPPIAPSAQAAAENVSLKPIDDLTINIQQPSGMLPKNYWGEHPQPAPLCDTCGTNRGWPFDAYHWLPTCLCYQPLYFEEPNLERYGYGCGCRSCCCSTCIQSACSAAHFFGTVPALPYMMAANCPCECNYALGDYRPGDCVPWRYQCCAPCSPAGALGEGAAAYGLILMLP